MVKLTLVQGDTLRVLKRIPDESIDCVVTSPPYWGLRDYGVEGQIGLEPTLEEYLERLFRIMKELKRVLKKTGVIFWNHGDCYSGSGKGYGSIDPKYPSARDTRNTIRPNRFKIDIPQKCMCLQNYRFILRCIDELGLILRDTIIWAKKIWIAKENTTIGNAMPSSVQDRCVFTYEPIFMLVKNKKYFFDQDALRVPYTQPLNRWGGDRLEAKGKSEWDNGTGQQTYRDRDMRPNPTGANRPNVWQINTEPVAFAHFACFPTELVKWLILAGCPQWICKKCGKARERIVDKNYIPTRPGLKTGQGKSGTDLDPNKSLHQRDISKYRMRIEYYTIGWTDCGCKEHYCCNCKKFINLKTLNKYYAIQRLGKTKGSSEEILSKEKRILQEILPGSKDRTSSQQVSKEDLRDLWQRILWKKKPEDLFQEVWSSITDKRGETSYISQRAETTKLQGWNNKQRRIQDNSSEWKENDGTSLDNGTASGEKTTCLGGGSSQKWDKDRQPNREFRDCCEEDALWRSIVPILSKEFQSEIRCPFCGSSQITLKHPGWEIGVVLDPFLGSGTTMKVCLELKRNCIGIEINPEYIKIAKERLNWGSTLGDVQFEFYTEEEFMPV